MTAYSTAQTQSREHEQQQRMPRKKTAPQSDVIEGIAEINDGEQLVEETTRKVRRERVAETAAALATGGNEIMHGEMEDPARPRFSETSLAAKLFAGEDGDSFGSQYCTVNV